MKRRAIVFCIVAIILLVLTHAVFALWVGDYPWYEPDPRVSIVTTILALIYVFFPFAASKTLSLFLEIPLGIIGLAEILVYYILVVLICSLEVGVAISILGITGSVLILGGYTLGDYTVGGPLVASIGTIAFVTILLLFGMRLYKTTRKLVKNTWDSLWHIFEAWVPYPGRLMAKIWDIATQLGELVAERVIYLITNNDWNGCVKLGKSAVRPLIATLKDKDENKRVGAAKALGEIGDSRAVEPLIAELKDESVIVRMFAAIALGKIRDDRAGAVEPLIVLLKDENIFARQAAAIALGEIGDSRAKEPLMLALKDVDKHVRKKAKEALGKIKSREDLGEGQ